MATTEEPSAWWQVPPVGVCISCGKDDYGTEFGPRTLLVCSCCTMKFSHVGCYEESTGQRLGKEEVESDYDWFCCKVCEEVHTRLNALVGQRQDIRGEPNCYTMEVVHNRKGCRATKNTIDTALNIFRTAFDPLIMGNGKDLVEMALTSFETSDDELYGEDDEDSEAFDFSNFRLLVLRKGATIVTVATLRVFGDRFAELPFVATRSGYRREGNCKRLLKAVEDLLVSMRVQYLVLPSIRSVLNMWTRHFHFVPVTLSESRALEDIIVSPDPSSAVLVKKPMFARAAAAGAGARGKRAVAGAAAPAPTAAAAGVKLEADEAPGEGAGGSRRKAAGAAAVPRKSRGSKRDAKQAAKQEDDEEEEKEEVEGDAPKKRTRRAAATAASRQISSASRHSAKQASSEDSKDGDASEAAGDSGDGTSSEDSGDFEAESPLKGKGRGRGAKRSAPAPAAKQPPRVAVADAPDAQASGPVAKKPRRDAPRKPFAPPVAVAPAAAPTEGATTAGVAAAKPSAQPAAAVPAGGGATAPAAAAAATGAQSSGAGATPPQSEGGATSATGAEGQVAVKPKRIRKPRPPRKPKDGSEPATSAAAAKPPRAPASRSKKPPLPPAAAGRPTKRRNKLHTRWLRVRAALRSRKHQRRDALLSLCLADSTFTFMKEQRRVAEVQTTEQSVELVKLRSENNTLKRQLKLAQHRISALLQLGSAPPTPQGTSQDPPGGTWAITAPLMDELTPVRATPSTLAKAWDDPHGAKDPGGQATDDTKVADATDAELQGGTDEGRGLLALTDTPKPRDGGMQPTGALVPAAARPAHSSQSTQPAAGAGVEVGQGLGRGAEDALGGETALFLASKRPVRLAAATGFHSSDTAVHVGVMHTTSDQAQELPALQPSLAPAVPTPSPEGSKGRVHHAAAAAAVGLPALQITLQAHTPRLQPPDDDLLAYSEPCSAGTAGQGAAPAQDIWLPATPPVPELAQGSDPPLEAPSAPLSGRSTASQRSSGRRVPPPHSPGSTATPPCTLRPPQQSFMAVHSAHSSSPRHAVAMRELIKGCVLSTLLMDDSEDSDSEGVANSLEATQSHTTTLGAGTEPAAHPDLVAPAVEEAGGAVMASIPAVGCESGVLQVEVTGGAKPPPAVTALGGAAMLGGDACDPHVPQHTPDFAGAAGEVAAAAVQPAGQGHCGVLPGSPDASGLQPTAMPGRSPGQTGLQLEPAVQSGLESAPTSGGPQLEPAVQSGLESAPTSGGPQLDPAVQSGLELAAKSGGPQLEPAVQSAERPGGTTRHPQLEPAVQSTDKSAFAPVHLQLEPAVQSADKPGRTPGQTSPQPEPALQSADKSAPTPGHPQLEPAVRSVDKSGHTPGHPQLEPAVRSVDKSGHTPGHPQLEPAVQPSASVGNAPASLANRSPSRGPPWHQQGGAWSPVVADGGNACEDSKAFSNQVEAMGSAHNSGHQSGSGAGSGAASGASSRMQPPAAGEQGTRMPSARWGSMSPPAARHPKLQAALAGLPSTAMPSSPDGAAPHGAAALDDLTNLMPPPAAGGPISARRDLGAAIQCFGDAVVLFQKSDATDSGAHTSSSGSHSGSAQGMVTQSVVQPSAPSGDAPRAAGAAPRAASPSCSDSLSARMQDLFETVTNFEGCTSGTQIHHPAASRTVSPPGAHLQLAMALAAEYTSDVASPDEPPVRQVCRQLPLSPK